MNPHLSTRKQDIDSHTRKEPPRQYRMQAMHISPTPPMGQSTATNWFRIERKQGPNRERIDSALKGRKDILTREVPHLPSFLLLPPRLQRKDPTVTLSPTHASVLPSFLPSSFLPPPPNQPQHRSNMRYPVEHREERMRVTAKGRGAQVGIYITRERDRERGGGCGSISSV